MGETTREFSAEARTRGAAGPGKTRASLGRVGSRCWVSEFTDLAMRKGVVKVAFVIGVYARHIVGWRVHEFAFV